MNKRVTTFQNTRISGFTLIELMITLAISAILLSVAAPSFSTIIQDNRITTQANQFVAAINYARSEAIKRGVNIDLTSTSGDENWAGGWTVAVNGGATLKVFPALDGSSSLINSNDNSTFQYQPGGRASVTDTFSLCDGRENETGRQLSISTTGRLSVSDLACS